MVAAIAACLLIVCGVIFCSQLFHRIEISVYGEPITDQTVFVDTPAPASNEVREAFPAITVPLEIAGKYPRLYPGEGRPGGGVRFRKRNVIGFGPSCEETEAVRVQWTVEQLDQDRVYELKIGDAVLFLSYDGKSKCWVLNKQSSEV